ncbi:uncharacterized protein LOC129297126 [Prosopis cineraria]|uniref:uncharacterized protein LOC129297126 n=1 Tax=Prosopis cineraria TaxID=364024 RepID=UPI0024107DE6|nr:uncharacterized protein LOC129297126 [Prosopis cineraria]
MEETDSKMWPELIAKALVDTIAKSHELREALAAWTEATKAKAERYKGERRKEATSSSSDYSLAKCVIALEEMGDDAEYGFVEALKILKSDPEWREIFLTMTYDKKKRWLSLVEYGRL